LRGTSTRASTAFDELMDYREKEGGEREACRPTGFLTNLFRVIDHFCSLLMPRSVSQNVKCIK